MSEPDDRVSELIEFKPIGIGGADTVTEEGWKMKTLGQHLKDEGYWGVSRVKILSILFNLAS